MIIRSTDNGTSWSESVQGLRGLHVYGFARSSASLIAATDRGIYRSDDDGSTWTYSSSGLPASSGGVFAATDGTLFTWSGPSVYRSLDGGSSWSHSKTFSAPTFAKNVRAGTGGASGAAFVGLSYPTWFGLPDPTVPTGMVYRTTDGGSTWWMVQADSVNRGDSVTDLVSGGTANICGSLAYGGLIVSTDNGSTWTRTESKYVTKLSSDAAGIVFGGTPQGVARSTDHGLTWTDLPAAGLVGRFGQNPSWVTALAFQSPGKIFVGTRSPDFSTGDMGSGVFQSTDNGVSFMNVGEGLGLGERPFVQALHITPDRRLLAGTYGEGPYVSSLLTGVEEETAGVPTSFKLDRNYPNPFNPTTRVRFSLPSSVNVKLKIYTLLGQEVITLVDENLPAGTHERSWNGRDQSGRGLSSGVYLLRLVAGPYRAAQKMILVK